MDHKKLHLIVLSSCLLICAFIYIDAYLLPRKLTEEKVVALNSYNQRGKNSSSTTYVLSTLKRDYNITESLYMAVSIGDTIYFERSTLTWVPQFAIAGKENQYYEYKASFLRANFGLLFIPAIALGLIVMQITYKKIDSPQGKWNLPLLY